MSSTQMSNPILDWLTIIDQAPLPEPNEVE